MTISLPPIVLMVGETLLRREKIAHSIEKLRSEISGEVSVGQFYVSDRNIDKFLSDARSLPFLSDFQILILKGVEELKKGDCELLAQYLGHPFEKSQLILEADSLGAGSPLLEVAKKYGQIVLLADQEKGGAGKRIIQQKLQAAQKKMSPGAVSRLMSGMQEAPIFLESVMDQIILYSGESVEITEKMVEAFEEKWQETHVFALTRALTEGSTGKALEIFGRILSEGESDEIQMMGLLHWHVRRYWKAAVLLEEGASPQEAMRLAGVSAKQAPFFMRQLKRFPLPRLEEILEALFQLDWKIKTGEVTPRLGLETWIIRATR